MDRGSKGLKHFVKRYDLNARSYLDIIQGAPKFRLSIRPMTLKAKDFAAGIDAIVCQCEKVFPRVKRPDVYFVIGCLSSGGTTGRKRLLMGSEIVMADSTTVKTELNAWLNAAMRRQTKVLPNVRE